MIQVYTYEPPKLEIMLTECIGNSLLRGYYSSFAAKLGIQKYDRVLDYCSGSGIITKEIAKRQTNGLLVYADVSRIWLEHVSRKLEPYKWAKQAYLCDFNSIVSEGKFDKIVLHFSLHDFPPQYRDLIINQLVRNLKSGGCLFIREPIGEKHGLSSNL
jgi:ubiquinone/menaquinone biosynthesis C-methylase UbiE